MDEDTFQRGLDRRPSDGDLRLVFADWLEECGDWRALGYRWMGTHRKWPNHAGMTWDWWNVRWLPMCGTPLLVTALIESELFEQLVGWKHRGPDYREFKTRSEAEEALCRVLAKRT